MAVVTKEQIQYAISRIKKVAQNKINTYKEKECLIRPAGKLTLEEKKEKIMCGLVPVLDGVSDYRLCDVFDFSEYVHKAEYDEEKLSSFSTNIGKEVSKAIDSIVLGDADDIMKVIADFEKKMSSKCNA